MAIQLSVPVRNARLDAVETTIGASPTMELRSGPPPLNCAAADTGTLLAGLVLPADWLNPASSGVKTLQGTWEDPSADNAGTVGHFRIKQGGVCHMQGTVGLSTAVPAPDMVIDNAVITAGQPIVTVSFNLNEANA